MFIFSILYLIASLLFRLLVISFIFGFILYMFVQLIHYKLKWQHKRSYSNNIKIISFVHPFCADCGGGEKVLWRMITSLISLESQNPSNRGLPFQKLKINIISGRKDNKLELEKKLKDRFNIDLKFNSNSDNIFGNNVSDTFLQSRMINNRLVYEVELIPMRSGYMLRPKNFLTMLLQILGQIYFALEIVTNVYSDVYCDTTGLPFCYFILKHFGHAKITAYTHYPFISYDMISQVQSNRAGVHSRGAHNKNNILKPIKLFYYKQILKLYKLMGNKCLSFSYVNSTWTYNRMKELWDELDKNQKLEILYPPCSISLYKEAAKNQQRENIIVSFAQFRPEKNQEMQIQILSKLKDRLNNYGGFQDLELHIIGGVRNSDDEKILEELKVKSRKLGVQDYVKFLPNGSIEEIMEEFSRAKIGIHTMIDEHFGITLIEMMAAGLIVVTHNSAGAKDDILITKNNEEKPGFLVQNENDYVKTIEEILINYDEMKNLYIAPSRRRAENFSDEAFEMLFKKGLNKFLL